MLSEVQKNQLNRMPVYKIMYYIDSGFVTYPDDFIYVDSVKKQQIEDEMIRRTNTCKVMDPNRMRSENLTHDELVMLKSKADRISVNEIVDLILKYGNLSLEDLKPHLIQEKYEIIEERLIDTIGRLFQYCISDESIYAFCVQEEKRQGILRIPICDFISRVFGNEKILSFAFACNLYAYAIRTKNTDIKRSVQTFLRYTDDRFFGRYGYSQYDFNKYLLPYTYSCIPGLRAWIKLLEYTDDIYPCMPDMEWWRKEGNLQAAKSVCSSVMEYCNSCPESIFQYKAVQICSNDIETLSNWLYGDMRDFPEKYDVNTIAKSRNTSTSDPDDENCSASASLLEFLLKYGLIDASELLARSLISQSEYRDLLKIRKFL